MYGTCANTVVQWHSVSQCPFKWPVPSEASCRDVIRQARLTRVKSKGLKALASVNLKKSESGAHRIFKKFGQSVPVKISRIDLPTQKKFAWVKFSDWLKYLGESERLDLLVGVETLDEMKPLLKEFWGRYREIAPSHEIFARHDAGLLDLSQTIPLLHHGDEGRGYKKAQVMVASTHGLLGAGCRVTEPSELKPAAPGSVDDPMKVNMVGNTFMTHFIQFLMPVAKYKECPEAFYTLLQAIADDYKYIFEKGIKFGKHGKIWGCALACKGDAPYITKSGRFDRSFYHRPLQARSKKPGVGVCHMCMAGVESRHQRVEFEEFGTCPTWMHTEEESPAFTDPSPFLSIPRETDNPNGERFWKFDVFHNFHLGAGKYFLSSAIVHIVQTVVLGSNIDIRFENLTKEFIAFCRKEKLNAYYKRLTKEMFGIAQNHQAWPKGNWPKGDQTTVLALFLEDYCNRNIVGKVQDPICLKIVAGRFSLHIFGFFWLD